MSTKNKRKRYAVCVAGEWINCKVAEEQTLGWLHYELSDGTIGLAQPGKWRIRGQTDGEETSTKLIQDLRALHDHAATRAGNAGRDFTEALGKHGAAQAIVTHGEALVASQRARELWDAFVARWSDAPGSELDRRLVEAVRATLLDAVPEPAEDGWFEAAVGDARGRETNRFRKQMRDVQRRIGAGEAS